MARKGTVVVMTSLKNYKKIDFLRAASMFLLAAVIIFNTFGFSEINSVHADEVTDLESQIEKLEKNNKAIEANLKNVKGQIASEQEEQLLLSEKISNTKEQIALYEKKIKSMQENIAKKESEISQKLVDIEENEQMFAERVRSMYIAGSTSTLTAVLSSESFSELLTRTEILKRISQSDQKLIDTLSGQKDELNSIKSDMETQNTALNATKSNLSAKSAELNTLNNQSKANEAKLKKTEETYYYAKKNNEKKIKANEAEITRILKERENTGTAPAEGTYKWPVPTSARITSPFGYRTIFGKQEFHLGIDIGEKSGSSIVAANDGEVIMVKKQSYGYGWHLIVDHGGGQATLYAHTSRIDVKVGDKVKRGQVIAGVGTTGASTGNHLHFEVRINGQQKDPMGYVRKPA